MKDKKMTIEKKYNLVGTIMDYEEGELSFDETLELFSHLIKGGLLNSLQGCYGRATKSFIESGYLSEDGEIYR